METWIKKINSASLEELEKIKVDWSFEGRHYEPQDWGKFWDAITKRELELSGVKISDPAF